MSAVERLAEQWNSEPNYGTSAYDLARTYERTMKTTQLREAIEEDRAAEVRAGVVAEEPEWEYGTIARFANGLTYSEIPWGSREQAEQVIADSEEWESDATDETRMTYELVKRVPEIKPGPWVPVKQEGAESDG